MREKADRLLRNWRLALEERDGLAAEVVAADISAESGMTLYRAEDVEEARLELARLRVQEAAEAKTGDAAFSAFVRHGLWTLGLVALGLLIWVVVAAQYAAAAHIRLNPMLDKLLHQGDAQSGIAGHWRMSLGPMADGGDVNAQGPRELALAKAEGFEGRSKFDGGHL